MHLGYLGRELRQFLQGCGGSLPIFPSKCPFGLLRVPFNIGASDLPGSGIQGGGETKQYGAAQQLHRLLSGRVVYCQVSPPRQVIIEWISDRPL